MRLDVVVLGSREEEMKSVLESLEGEWKVMEQKLLESEGSSGGENSGEDRTEAEKQQQEDKQKQQPLQDKQQQQGKEGHDEGGGPRQQKKNRRGSNCSNNNAEEDQRQQQHPLRSCKSSVGSTNNLETERDVQKRRMSAGSHNSIDWAEPEVTPDCKNKNRFR